MYVKVSLCGIRNLAPFSMRDAIIGSETRYVVPEYSRTAVFSNFLVSIEQTGAARRSLYSAPDR